MQKPLKKQVRKRALPKDVNQRTHRFVELTTQGREDARTTFKSQLSEYMTKLGKKGGKVSGETRKQWLPEEDRIRIASLAAKARWEKARKKKIG